MRKLELYQINSITSLSIENAEDDSIMLNFYQRCGNELNVCSQYILPVYLAEIKDKVCRMIGIESDDSCKEMAKIVKDLREALRVNEEVKLLHDKEIEDLNDTLLNKDIAYNNMETCLNEEIDRLKNELKEKDAYYEGCAEELEKARKDFQECKAMHLKAEKDYQDMAKVAAELQQDLQSKEDTINQPRAELADDNDSTKIEVENVKQVYEQKLAAIQAELADAQGKNARLAKRLTEGGEVAEWHDLTEVPEGSGVIICDCNGKYLLWDLTNGLPTYKNITRWMYMPR